MFDGIVTPFTSGNVRMDMRGNKLYMVTSRIMFSGHQSNISFLIDTKTMKHQLANDSYVSHSFNQYVKFDANNLYVVDHGDAYERGINITVVKNYGTTNAVTKDILPFKIKGKTGDNYTGLKLGGVETTLDNIITVGTSVPQNYKVASVTGNSGKYKKNVFMTITDKNTLKSKTKIIEIAIPPNVKVIGDWAFSHTPLENIILHDNLKCITAGMLSNTELEKITIPESVVHIEYGAFEDSKLKEIELPQNLYSIGSFAFNIPSLEKIIIHSNVEIMEENIFGKQYGERVIDLTICCPAGSKAQLYARKYGCNCCEIPKSLTANKEICARGLWVKFALLKEKIELDEWCKILNINKAEMWSWEKKSSLITINKEQLFISNVFNNYQVTIGSSWGRTMV